MDARVLLVLIAALGGCLSLPVTTVSEPMEARVHDLREGIVSFVVERPGTYVVRAEHPESWSTDPAQYEFLFMVRVSGPGGKAHYSDVLQRGEHGAITSLGGIVTTGEASNYFRRFGDNPAPQEFYFVFAVETIGPWLVSFGQFEAEPPAVDAEFPRVSPPPAAIPPSLAIYDPAAGVAINVTVENHRTGSGPGVFASSARTYAATTGELRTEKPYLVVLATYCKHDGEGRFWFDAWMDEQLHAEGIYDRFGFQGTATVVRHAEMRSSATLRFEPLLDSRTACFVSLAAIPLLDAGLDRLPTARGNLGD